MTRDLPDSQIALGCLAAMIAIVWAALALLRVIFDLLTTLTAFSFMV